MYNIAKCINTNDYSSLIAGAEYTRDHHNDDNTPQAMAMSRVDWNAVDILCIAFGTNDWTGSVLGSDFTVDSTGGSFIGALCFSIEQVLEKFPHIQIVLIGMSFRLRGNGNADENSDNWLNKFGHSLQEYQNAILDVAEKYHIPAFDMYRLSGVNELTYKKYLRDGVHPIPNTGYQHWANKIGSFLNSVI
ncbi:SGNH/GDSL hydrolase family protein [Acinetobacter rudis]|uniref:SGNH/GDSL hydrolase family protein n=1 Tax=Acinetobacter rudis TaxID=632955 RepID=UPI001D1724C0|nr:SGNH/GDSL hydrolase family protein [Acinetobacter rudis]